MYVTCSGIIFTITYLSAFSIPLINHHRRSRHNLINQETRLGLIRFSSDRRSSHRRHFLRSESDFLHLSLFIVTPAHQASIHHASFTTVWESTYTTPLHATCFFPNRIEILLLFFSFFGQFLVLLSSLSLFMFLRPFNPSFNTNPCNDLSIPLSFSDI